MRLDIFLINFTFDPSIIWESLWLMAGKLTLDYDVIIENNGKGLPKHVACQEQ